MKRLACSICLTLFAAAAAAANLEVSNGWIRLLPSPVPAGGYFEVRNNASAPAQLVGVSSPAFAEAMLHETMEEKGQSMMMPVERIEVPARGNVVFKPGGYHLMLMKPTRAIKVGDRVPVTLEFADGQKVTAQFEVRGPAGK